MFEFISSIHNSYCFYLLVGIYASYSHRSLSINVIGGVVGGVVTLLAITIAMIAIVTCRARRKRDSTTTATLDDVGAIRLPERII